MTPAAAFIVCVLLAVIIYEVVAVARGTDRIETITAVTRRLMARGGPGAAALLLLVGFLLGHLFWP